MQVSTKLFNQQSVNQFGKLTEEIQKLQGKVSTGNNILKSSDDPVAAVELSAAKEQKNILQNESVQNTHQVALYDAKGIEYWIDQAERLNAYGFNKFKGWMCNSGYQSCIIRSNEVKRAYSCLLYTSDAADE